MSARFAALRRRLHDAWAVRTPRERRALRLAAGVLLAAVWLQLVWHAAERRQILEPEVQRLKSRVALAEALAAQIANPPAPAAVAVTASAPTPPAYPGLDMQPAGMRCRISGTVSFDAWVGWLGELQRSQHVVLASARIRRTSVPGQVDIEGELEWAP